MNINFIYHLGDNTLDVEVKAEGGDVEMLDVHLVAASRFYKTYTICSKPRQSGGWRKGYDPSIHQ